MLNEFTRRDAIRHLTFAGIVMGSGAILRAEDASPQAPTKKQKVDKGPRLDLEMVAEFVGVAHRDLDRVKA